MKRTLLGIIATVSSLYLLITYKAPPVAFTAAATSTAGTTPGATTPSTVSPALTQVTLQPPSATDRTVDGPTENTRYGPVQVSITVNGTSIVGVRALQIPTGGYSDTVEAMAVPKLDTETLAAQTANIASVSGATYTSAGWKTSLGGAIQSAQL